MKGFSVQTFKANGADYLMHNCYDPLAHIQALIMY